MGVYVDDASIPAELRDGPRVRHSQWSHLTADTRDELHEFAARLGLRREWFQPGRPLGGQPSPFWHYDLTRGKRAQALALGAVSMPARDLARHCRDRAEQATQPSSDTENARPPDARPRGRRAAPEHPCPGCGTAELARGREACQACGLLQTFRPSPEGDWPDLSHGNAGHMCVLPRRAGREAEAGS